ncbi:MAG TPA: hypothetical protein VGD21_10875 [Lysobacter sp.]
MAESPFNIEFQSDGGRLRAHVVGVNGTLETTLAYWLAIAAEVRARAPSMLLVVDDMTGEPPPPEQLQQFVSAMAGLGFEGLRIAYVEADGDQIPLVEVAEIFAREQGFNARVFGNEADAAVWLRHGEP